VVIEQKYKQGVGQERIRRLTHPQQEGTQPEAFPKPRPTSNIVYYKAFASQAAPALFHSPSLGSITGDRRDELNDSEEEDGPRSRSRPDLSIFSREVETDAGKDAPPILPAHDYLRLSSSTSKDNMQLVLLSAQSLVKQIEVVSKSAPLHRGPIESTPVKDNQHKLINKSMASAQKVADIFQHLLSSEGVGLKDRQFSHSNSCTTNMSRMSSVGSASMGPEKDSEINSVLSEPGKLYTYNTLLHM